MNVFQKLGQIVRGRSFRIPNVTKWPAIGMPSFAKFPSVGFGNSRIKYVVGGSVFVSGAAVVVGLYFAVYDIASATYEWPRAGAVYAELDEGHTLGQPLPAEEDGTESQTLLILLAANARLSSLTLNNLDVGRTAMTDPCFEIDREANNSSGYLHIDQFTITGLSAPTMDIGNSEIANLSLAGSIDGYTLSPTVNNAIADQVILSVRDTGDFIAEDAVVDRVVIHTLGNATIGQLIVNGFACSISAPVTNNVNTGAVDFDYMKVGNFTMDATSRVGDGDGIDAADLVVNTTVSARSIVNNLVDTPLAVR
jgi:hypothetical protein|tara:strand:+ start:282 stop:1208 length:927 start_codon:yes stop_codon:yes gene_type:complete